jgi:competence protein ComEA
MDNSLFKDRLLAFIQANFLSVLLGIGGLIFLGFGLLSLSTPKQDNKDILFEAASDKSPEAKALENKVKKQGITVDIEGAVMKPGVYTFAADSRIQDALIVAGGMSKEADRAQVTKGLNLASKLIDGGKIYIPFQGEQVAMNGNESILGSQSGGVDLNTASQQALEALPGIGEVTAKKIIEARPYHAIDELLQKKVVGQKVYEQIKEKVSVN